MFNNVKLLVLWTTNDCNLRCKYCYAKAGTKKDYMDFETAKRIIETIPNDNFKIQLAGGEPLLNFSLIENMHDYIRKERPKVNLQMQSNGTLITEKIAKSIKKMNIAMGISLDGNIDINENLRGKTLDTINGIKLLGKENVMVNLNCVVTNKSIDGLDKLVDIAYYLGNVGGIGLDLLRKTGRAIESEVKSASPIEIKVNLKKAYSRTVELSKLTGRRVVIREIEDARKRLEENISTTNYCHATYGGSIVGLPNGTLYPCGSLVNIEKYFMVNIYKNTSLKTIKINYKNSEMCNRCKYNSICIKACPARSIINCKEGSIPIEDCTLRKTAFEIVEEEMEGLCKGDKLF